MDGLAHPKYSLFESIAEMLAPETLSSLLDKPVMLVEYNPMDGHSGLAGGRFCYIDTDAGRFILKQMSKDFDFLMCASQDDQCRAVRLWQYGLLDRMQPHFDHKIIACAREGELWAILMHDLTGKVLSWDKPFPRKLVLVFLDRMARLHAAFWNDPLLGDPRLGLWDTAREFDLAALAKEYVGGGHGVLPEWIVGGWEAMEALLDRDVFQLMLDLHADPVPLLAALDSFPYTLVHGDYRANNLAYLEPAHPVVLDWQNSRCSLMTTDLVWFTKQGDVRKEVDQEWAFGYYRQRLEKYLKFELDDAGWQIMLDLGIMFDTLTSICFAAYWAKHSDSPEGRASNESLVKERSQQVREAVRWL